MERGAEISRPPPAAMFPRPYRPAMGRRHPVSRRSPPMAPQGREQERKSRLGSCPPPMGQDWRMKPAKSISTHLRYLERGEPMKPAEPMRGLLYPELTPDVVKSIAARLGYNGAILLLFETPSGFALFSFFGIYLYEPDAMENLWVNFVEYSKARQIASLRAFQSFDDKHSAINRSTGVSESLRNMILNHLLPGQILAVGKDEYKEIIEKTLGIECLCDENVIEAMWGLQNLMHRFVPQEKSLTKDDCLTSHGLNKVLSRYGFDKVEPKMVNEQILMVACALFECDYIDKKYGVHLDRLSQQIKHVSGTDTAHWSPLKCATALKVIFCPEEAGDYNKILLEDERSKLVDDAHKCARLIHRIPALNAFEEMFSAYEVRNQKKILLSKLVTEAMVQKVGV